MASTEDRARLETDITRLRGEVHEIVAELEDRVRRATDLEHQARRVARKAEERWPTLIATGVALILLAVGYVALLTGTTRRYRDGLPG